MEKVSNKQEKIDELNQFIKRLDEKPIVKKINLPVYYINMDKYPDRKEFMEKELDTYTKSYQRIRGFNGYEIKDKSSDKVDGIEFINEYRLTNGEIGCTMSHLMAIKTAYDNNDDVSLIMEDDTKVHLINHIDFTLEDIIDSAPSDWEIIKLFSMNDPTHLPKGGKVQNHTYYYEGIGKETKSAVGYLINRSGMKKIMDHTWNHKSYPSFTIKRVQDNIPAKGTSDVFLYNLAKTYTLHPNILYPYNVNLSSTIHDNHTFQHFNRAYQIIKSYPF